MNLENTIFVLIFYVFIFSWKKIFVHGELDAGLQQRQKLLEDQIQAADRAIKSTADRSVRMSAFQLQTGVNQLQLAKTMQTIAANVLTTSGLNDVNRRYMSFDCEFNNSERTQYFFWNIFFKSN